MVGDTDVQWLKLFVKLLLYVMILCLNSYKRTRVMHLHSSAFHFYSNRKMAWRMKVKLPAFKVAQTSCSDS